MKYFKEENISKIITKLIKDTRSGILEWEEDYTNIDLGEERILGKPYVTELNHRMLRIYKYKYKHYTDYDQYVWSESFRLEFIDGHGNSEWEFPNTGSVRDLYESVTYQISDVDDFFDEYLKN